MRCEIPIVNRCCCCIPLRKGLLVWAYLKLIGISLLWLLFMFVKIAPALHRFDAVSFIIFTAIMLTVLADMAFHILFVISAHKKDYRKMRIFYRYSVFIICLTLAVDCIYLSYGFVIIITYGPLELPRLFWVAIFSFTGMSFLSLCVQGYLIVLVRSEFLKLKAHSQFEFVNNATDAECTVSIDFNKENDV